MQDMFTSKLPGRANEIIFFFFYCWQGLLFGEIQRGVVWYCWQQPGVQFKWILRASSISLI